MYHEHLGSIWKGEDVIPPTLLKVSEFEKKEAWKILNSRGVYGEFIVAIPVQPGNKSSGQLKIILPLSIK